MYHGREHFRDWVLVSATKERQNESYLEAAVRTERCNAVAWQRLVGERRGRLALPKQGRVAITRRQIGLASTEPFCACSILFTLDTSLG